MKTLESASKIIIKKMKQISYVKKMKCLLETKGLTSIVLNRPHRFLVLYVLLILLRYSLYALLSK
jgi:hypothetical protein